MKLLAATLDHGAGEYLVNSLWMAGWPFFGELPKPYPAGGGVAAYGVSPIPLAKGAIVAPDPPPLSQIQAVRDLAGTA